MNFYVLSLFPEVIKNGSSFSILKRASENGLINVKAINPRDYTLDKHKKVDDTPYGGGAGMLLACQPYIDAYNSIKKLENSKTVIMSPQGKVFNQEMAKEYAGYSELIIICGHYEGFDDRIKQITKADEVSIGDFVLTGGEMPALCIIDSVTRLLDGALGDEESKEYDSHYDGLLEHPHYTKPREYMGLAVPEVLVSGNHEKIKEWRRYQQFLVTKEKRPDLYEKFLNSELSEYDKKILKKNNLI